MGAISALLFLDVADLTTRVLPTLHAWIETGELDAVWGEALTLERRPPPAEADRAVLRAAFLDPQRRRHAGGLVVPAEPLQQQTRGAIEMAVLTATRGDGLAFGNARWLTIDAEAALPDLLPGLFDEVLTGAAPSTRLGTLLHALDQGASAYAVSDGGYGEGLRGLLDVAETSEIAPLLAAALPTIQAGDVLTLAAERGALAERGVSAQTATMVLLERMARLATDAGLGLLHGRDLAVRSFARWEGGVLARHHASACSGPVW